MADVSKLVEMAIQYIADIEMLEKNVSESMNESRSERDTQFKGYAENLWDEIIQAGIDGIYGEDTNEYCKRIIAQRAYDLVKHVIAYVDTRDLDMLEEHECVQRIPDMTALPKEAQ